MKIEISLGRKIALAIALGLLVLIVVGVVSFRSIHEFIRSADDVTQSHRLMTALETTLGHLATAESEARGYVITGNDRYLALYQLAIGAVEIDLSQLRDLMGAPGARRHLNELERLSRDRLDRLKATVAIRKLEGFEAVEETAGSGKTVMDALRRVIGAIEDEENTRLRAHDREARTLAGRTTWVIALGSLLAILIAAFSTAVIVFDLAHRERLERDVLEISEREQRRIGRDLHDGVCQHLTGVALLNRSLQQKLARRAAAEADEAARITGLITEGIEQARRVTHGLHPVANEPTGLMLALQDLAASVQAAGQMACPFECPEPVLVPDQMAATHLYRIAQEAVQNAIRHAHPSAIHIRLASDENHITLTVADDGGGLPEKRRRTGLGLEIMNYRAHTLGATLELRRGAERGTVVQCVMPRSALA